MISFTAEGWLDERVVERVAAVIVGRKEIWPSDSGLKWQIGAANNHWLVREGNTWRLVFRYRRDADLLRAVRVLLERLVGFDDVRVV